ncbi:hypothetical protein ACE1YR_11630 [Pseudomonas sp. K1(2024)]|uniref:Phage protein n=1 Tax=Pseudomonas boreofloridensis TaxID=3064348 RepID=A0ABV4Z8V9_9PSED|nr:hypothetical protein [Pseudomonas sp. K13]MDO7901598.1 hypothetical protein [Pseudomonas sp. K13]
MSELATLHAALTATIREAIPELASVDTYTEAEKVPALPSLRHGIVRMVADSAPRDGRSVLVTTFEADITPAASNPQARLQGSVLAAQVMDLLRQQLWGLEFVEPSRNVRAFFAGSGWRVRWDQPVLLGELQWDWPDEPAGSLKLGFSPDTGKGNEPHYFAPEDLA